MSQQEAIRLALSVLDSFKESSLYEDYQNEDGWTDEQYEEMLVILREQADQKGS